MTTYKAPCRDTQFVLEQVLGLEANEECETLASLDSDTIGAVVNEAGRFCSEIIAPLNPISDAQGCTHHSDGSVTTPEGFPAAYKQLVESGWGTLAQPEEFGGQGMGHVLSVVFEEYMNSACAAFTMYTGIMQGAVATVMSAGSDELKQRFVPNMISGEWLATMALTEAHAGTDLGLLRSSAKPNEDGSYSISGEKIFISGGDQDLTENIVHLVLARVPDAPVGTRGISLFLVPKIMPETGATNGVSVGSIEHKMGLNGSATCVLNFDNSTGYLLGEENAGLMAMFVMMNSARLAVGVQGLAHAEHAYEKASAYALERKQGRAIGQRVDPKEPCDPLIVHPDVRRLLLDTRGFVEGFRAVVLWTGMQFDISHGAPEKDARREADGLVSFLTPVIKAYGSDKGFDCAVTMQQIFGGHGYVKETGMEQIVRDARISMIYEGANGVQALDLTGRKLVKDGGKVAARFFALVEADLEIAPEFIAEPMAETLVEARAAAKWLLENAGANADNIGAGSYAFLQLIGLLATGWMWARMATIADGNEGDQFLSSKTITARHFAQQALPEAALYRRRVEAGAGNLMAMAPEQFVSGG